MLSGDNLPVVPSRESNSGLPYSKPTRCQLSHAAPYEPRRTIWATPHHLSHAAPSEPRRTIWATPHHNEPRRTIWATPHHNWTIGFKLWICFDYARWKHSQFIMPLLLQAEWIRCFGYLGFCIGDEDLDQVANNCRKKIFFRHLSLF